MAEPVGLGWGEQVPFFKAAALGGSPRYAFDTVAGRHVLMLLFGTASFAPSAEALALVQEHRRLFDDEQACFFGVSVDPKDAESGAIEQQLPGIRYFLDYDRSVSKVFGAVGEKDYHPHWHLLDPRLRSIGRFEIGDGGAAFQALQTSLADPFPRHASAPVLSIPNIFEPEMCRSLIEYYRGEGSEESGFMRDVDGKTVKVFDPFHKQRKDVEIRDEQLRAAIGARISRRLNGAISQAFRFEPTRMERYLVACYEAGAGHFRPHRDNTTRGTAHRTFAVTINLNEDYDGGDLRFPEFGPRTYRAPPGGAIVFSCALLHEATPVTRGTRYAFLPFLYDEAGAQLREANNAYLGEGVGEYQVQGADD